MLSSIPLKGRILFTTLVALIVWSDLLWDHFHDGVPSHYLLHDPDLPSFSNWWGGLLYPLLFWLLLQLQHQRLGQGNQTTTSTLWVQFAGGLLFGALLSISFSLGSEQVPALLMLGAIALSLFLPLFRPTYLMGYLLGMFHVFGGVLPIIIGSVMVLIFLVAYGLNRGIARLLRKGA